VTPRSSAGFAWRLGLGLFAAGMLVLGIGFLLHPESNLLGGFALLAAPLVGSGVVVLVSSGLRDLVRRSRGRNDGSGK